jgi:mannose-1-phosphate guanylyltransferase
MKAFLLAAGEGTRLRPLTFDTPKCLVPIGGVPLLEIWYRHLKRQGVGEVLINTHHFSHKVEEFVRRLKTPIQTRLTYEPKLLGSAGTILYNKDFVEDEPAFWIIYTDSVTTMNLEELLRFHQEKKSTLTMGLFHTDIPKESGIATLDEDGRITDFVEKPQDPPGDLSNTGIMVASQDLFKEIPDRFPCDLSYQVIPRLIGRMYGMVTDQFFIDIGNLTNYQTAQKKWESIKSMLGY